MTLENDASRANAANGHAYRISPIGLTSFVLALGALGTTLPGRYVADARFELYWGTSKYLGRHLSLWDSVRNLGRPVALFLACHRRIRRPIACAGPVTGLGGNERFTPR
jgi:hypothetical protein